MNYVVCVPDGCADEPVDELDGQTPLEAANLPTLSALAARGEVGRAAVIPEIAEAAVGLFATFGVADEVLMDAVFGVFNPSGKLPIELPSSMEAVRTQKEDVPYDSADPLFEFGHGLSYE